MYYSMEEPWGHYAMWKKPDAKGRTLYDSIDMKCPKQTNSQRQKGLGSEKLGSDS